LRHAIASPSAQSSMSFDSNAESSSMAVLIADIWTH
jgi:hypothetical protein